MKTTNKGHIALLKVELKCVEKGFIFLRPTMEGTRYDGIIDDGEKLTRVQIKYCDRKSNNSENAYTVGLQKWNGRGKTVKTLTYDKTELDALIVYFPALDVLCWIPIAEFENKTAISIRTKQPKNNQNYNCHMLEDYQW